MVLYEGIFMKTKIQLYDTQIRQDEQGRFCLNDLHQASGGESRHRPAYWLSNQQTQELIGENFKRRNSVYPYKTRTWDIRK